MDTANPELFDLFHDLPIRLLIEVARRHKELVLREQIVMSIVFDSVSVHG